MFYNCNYSKVNRPTEFGFKGVLLSFVSSLRILGLNAAATYSRFNEAARKTKTANNLGIDFTGIKQGIERLCVNKRRNQYGYNNFGKTRAKSVLSLFVV